MVGNRGLLVSRLRRDASASGRWKRVRYLIVLQDIGFVPAGEGG